MAAVRRVRDDRRERCRESLWQHGDARGGKGRTKGRREEVSNRPLWKSYLGQTTRWRGIRPETKIESEKPGTPPRQGAWRKK